MQRRRSAPVGQISDVEIKLLHVFKAVAERGGFAAAAPALGINPSTVSIHMTNLESRLNLRLCQRGRSGFALTEEGQQVYEASQRLLSSVENFRTEINSFHDTLRGDLNIGITDNLVTLPRMRVSDSLAAVKSQGSEIHINIHMNSSSEIARGVVDGRFHVGVVPAIHRLSALEYVPLYAEAVYLYCATNHALFAQDDGTISTVDIKACDAVQTPELTRTTDAQTLNVRATANGREGVAFLILTAKFVGYLPEHFAARWVQTGQMRAIKPGVYCHDIAYAIVTRRGRLHNRVLEQFLREIRKRQ